MTQRYLGGIITANPTEPSSNLSNASASGMWTLQEALSFYRAGDWPDPTNTPTVGLFAGGIGTDGSTQVNEIDTITPETLGDSTDFGDLSLARGGMAGFSSDTRGIFAGGQLNGSPYRSDTIDYVTFASAGNATDFGNLTYGGAYRSGLSNNVRGISAGGNNASQTVVNNIDYITIPSTGNATDFGDLTVARLKSNGGLASTTRGVIGGGYNDSSATLYNTIDYITIASTGNATDFGDLLSSSYTGASASNNTRGLFHEAYTGSNSNVISYITIASAGNATDFGDMLVAYTDDEGLANSTRGKIMVDNINFNKTLFSNYHYKHRRN